MRCPFCAYEESKVTDSRDAAESHMIRRRRECLSCNQRFTTFETIDLTIQVHKRDGTYEDFQLQKIINGLDAACRHSLISHDEVRALAHQIAADLMAKQMRVITSQELGDLIMEYLQKKDPIAYIRFACVYKRIKDLKELSDIARRMEP